MAITKVSICATCGKSFEHEVKRGPALKHCSECAPAAKKEANRLKAQKWRDADPGRARAAARAWNAANPQAAKAKKLKYNTANRDSIRAKDRERYWADPEASRARDHEKYWANPDAARATAKKWHEANRDTVVAKMRERYWADPEVTLAYHSKWRDTNRETLKSQGRARYAADPDHHKAKAMKRRVRRLAAEGYFSTADIDRIRKEQKGKCAYHAHCGHSLKTHGEHIDHIIPLARGGTNWPANLQLTCGPCNLLKGAKDPIDFARKLGKLL